jgi:hypothetical protein
MEVPDGYVPFTNEEQRLLDSGREVVLKIIKAIYGLHQSGHLFAKELFACLKAMGFKQLHTDPCVLTNGKVILSTYVDNICVFYKHESDFRNVLCNLQKKFLIHDEGYLKQMLGVQVCRDKTTGEYSIHQQGYIERMAEKYGLKHTKRCNTPMTPGSKLHNYENETRIDQTVYRKIIGSILYVSVATRPDITFALSQLARYSQDPRITHYKAAMRLLQYLFNTRKTRIVYRQSTGPFIQSYSDASWKSCKTTKRSQSGYITFAHGGPVLWNSKRQNFIATSSASAEYMAMAQASKDIIYISQLLSELGFKIHKVPLFVDASAAIAIAIKPGLTNKTKEIRLEYHFTRECVENNTIDVQKIQGIHNVADALTKPLHRGANDTHLKRMFQ